MYTYDAMGNLRNKTDYSANTANGVCQVITLDNRTVSFAYDQRGNLIQGDDLALTYNHFDKPIRVLSTGAGNRHASNATDTRFTYRPDQMRHKQVRIHNSEETSEKGSLENISLANGQQQNQIPIIDNSIQIDSSKSPIENVMDIFSSAFKESVGNLIADTINEISETIETP